VTGYAVVGEELTVSGNTYLDSSLNVTGYAVVGEDLTVSGNTYLDSSLNVTGYASIGKNLTVDGSLNVLGYSYLNTIVFSDNSTLSSSSGLSSTGSTTTFTTLTVSQYLASGGYFDVSGNAQFDSSLNVAGYVTIGENLTVTGTCTSTSYNSTSDYRIKQNITTLDDTFTVDDLNPVIYTNNKLNKQDIGFIAHEVQQIYPYLVTGNKDSEEIQTLNYNGIIGILVNEIQNIKKELKDLKNKLK